MAGLGLIGGTIGALFGVGQAIAGGIQAHRARRDLEGLQVPKTTSSSEISDYYNRAAQNPYNSAFYNLQAQNAQRGTSQGLSALQDRRAGLAGISGLVRAQNDSMLRAGASAEQQQWQQLGQATRMKAQDNQRVFNQNQMLPYQQRFGLLSAKAAGGNQIMNAGIQNIAGGLGMMAMGQGNGGGATSAGATSGISAVPYDSNNFVPGQQYVY